MTLLAAVGRPSQSDSQQLTRVGRNVRGVILARAVIGGWVGGAARAPLAARGLEVGQGREFVVVRRAWRDRNSRR